MNNKYIKNIIEYRKKKKIVYTEMAKRIIRKCNEMYNLQFPTMQACDYSDLLKRTICKIEKKDSDLSLPNNAIL